MDKEKAARILSKELGDKLGVSVVGEESYKRDLIKCASAKYQLSNPVLVSYEEGIFSSKKGYSLVELVRSYGDAFTEANYYFSEVVPVAREGYSTQSYALFAITPYSIISEKEKSVLRKIFYKNVHPEIAYAMSTLGIDNFIEFYKDYKESLLTYLATPIITKILNEDLEAMKKFIDFATKLKYDSDEEVNKKVFKQFGGIGSLNARLERLGVTTLIEPRVTSNHIPSDYVPRKVISRVIEQLSDMDPKTIKKRDNPLLNEFEDFVFFSLPYEEQNIESNKAILKSSSNLDFVAAVLSKEYSEGKYFQEYFEVVSKEIQDKTVESLKSLPSRKPVYDSFLWSKGFHNIELDYVSMYKDDANTFIDYFTKRSVQEKKVILKDIIGCDFVNEKVADWLNQNEADLLREVGLNG